MTAWSERGSAALEFTIIVPALGLLLAALIGMARIWFAHTIVEQVAGSAARAASIATNPAAAKAAAEHIAASQAATRGLNCGSLTVAVDVSAFQAPVGQPSQVQARVSCSVPLADLLVPGWPGEWATTAAASSVLDRYRRRG